MTNIILGFNTRILESAKHVVVFFGTKNSGCRCFSSMYNTLRNNILKITHTHIPFLRGRLC